MEKFALFHNRNTGDITVLATENEIDNVIDYIESTFNLDNVIAIPLSHCTHEQQNSVKENCLWNNPAKITMACIENWSNENEKLGSNEFDIWNLDWFIFAKTSGESDQIIDEYKILKIK